MTHVAPPRSPQGDDSPSWQHIFAIFEEAAELPTDERRAFLDRACGDDVVRRAVEDLLEADERGETPTIDRPLVQGPWAAGNAPTGVARPDPSLGTIGAYRLLRQVGQGGMSTVYLAVRADDAFRRHVAVKLVRRGMESDAILRRLRTERQILAGLDHPYVARLYDGGSTEDGLPYFVMEYVDGVPIDAYCEHNRLSVAERLALFRKVCAAVHYAHQNLIVHRDIKPSNILVTADGSPKLLDFGIAKLLNPDLSSAESEPTATWQRVMTPSYASPEQVRGQQITTASDIYSLGVLLYKLLTGRLPRSFKGRSQREIEQLLSESEPVRPSAAVRQPPAAEPDSKEASPAGRDPEWVKGFQRQLTGDLDAIVLKALRSAPPQRYGSVERFAEDTERYQRGLPVAARAGTWRYRTGKFVRRNRTAVAVATTIVVLLVGFAAAMAVQSARVARERDQARLERDKKQEVLALILDIFRFSDPYVLPGEELTVRDALERSIPVLESGLREQPEVHAELLHTSGSILTVLGHYHAAEEQLEEALEIRREIHGVVPGDVETMSALAAVRKELGKLDEAEALARQAVELARGLDGESGGGAHPSLLKALNELISVRCYQKQYEAAEDPTLEALELARRLPEAADQEILALESMAQIRRSRGDYPGAVALYRQSLAMRRERYGEKHPAQIIALNNLGLTLRRQEEFEAAERAYRELQELQRENFGEDYKDPWTLNNLAGSLFGKGDYPGAEMLYREALAVVLDTSGPEDWKVFDLELSILKTQIRGGAGREAEDRLRRLLERRRPELGEDHVLIVEGEGILGESLSLQSRCEDAEPLLVESYRQLLGGAKHRQKLDALERLRDHLERCGRPREIAAYEAMLTSEKPGSGR